MAIHNPLRSADSLDLASAAEARGHTLLFIFVLQRTDVEIFIDCLVAATKGCRKVSVLREAINDVGITAGVENVHRGCKFFTDCSIWAMVGCREHVIVDGLVVEMMQVGVDLRVA